MTTTADDRFLTARLLDDPEFLFLSRGAEVTFALATPAATLAVVRVHDGVPSEASGPDSAGVTVVLPAEAWEQVLAEAPRPGTQHILAHLAPRGDGELIGDPLQFAQHLHLIRRAIEVLADRPAMPAAAIDRSGIRGRYVSVDVEPWGTCDVYVETAGEGRPVLFLHTAGADSTQYHGLLGLAGQFPDRQLITFDLPWHGRSAPARGRSIHDYTLTSESYAGCVAAVIDALHLDEPPVIVGASMAGAAVVEVAARHPAAISGAIGCQAGPRVGNRHNTWLRSPVVNQTLFVPEWTYGLMSPHSPKTDRDGVWWGYSKGGYAIYERDITYYTTCWDVDNIAPLLTTATPPIVLMSGIFDYTVPPSATQALAAAIPGADYREMPELGHFPHAENPTAFAAHLQWALARIDERSTLMD